MSEFKTALAFVHCPSCKGFGYQVTGARSHVRCVHCKDNPSVFALHGSAVLRWSVALTPLASKQRALLRDVHRGYNLLLLLIAILGVAALVYAIVRATLNGADLFSLFTEPHLLMAVFWATILTDFYLFYRLEREAASQQRLRYDTDGNLTINTAVQKLANPTFEKIAALHHHQYIDIAPFFTQEALGTLDRSFDLARRLNHHQVTPLHVFSSLIESQSIAVMFARLGIDTKKLFEKIGRAMAMEGLQSGEHIDFSIEAKHSVFVAFEDAVLFKRANVDVMELFTAIVHQDPWMSDIVYDLEIDERTVQHVVEWVYIQRKLRQRYVEWRRKAKHKPKGIMNRAMTARPSPLLESISQDYTAIARMGGFFPLVGRQSEMNQVMRILKGRTGNILFVGPAGGGKSTLLEGIAERMASEDVPKELQDKRFVVLDPGSLIANAQGVGGVEGRMKEVIVEIARAGNILLGIEDVHHLLNMRSTTGSEDSAGILMNAMSQGFLKVVATTTTEEYQQFIENRAPFLRRFQVVKVDEMIRDDAILVLEAKAGSIEYTNKVFFSYAAIASAVDLSTRFIQDRYLPAKALDVITETAALAREQRGENAVVTPEDVAQVIAEKTNVRITAITEDEREKLLNLERIMHERIVGQDEAVSAVASALRRAREGLRDAHRPIATVLFLGPTGVGKTETAKTIAQVYFGNEKNMIRLDMSEFQDAGALRKLIGAKGEQGMLTEAVRLKPFSILLLDELEKAHPDVLNVFLQVMDDGRITDGTGRTFDMSNIMLIATSNAATQQIVNGFNAGLTVEQLKTRLLEETLPTLFRPEFINRFDNVVLFQPLAYPQVVAIAERMLKALSLKLLEEKGIAMEVEAEAVEEIAKKGFDPLYGARPLRRVIQDTVNDALAKLLLSQQINRRDVVVLRAGGIMEIKKAVAI